MTEGMRLMEWKGEGQKAVRRQGRREGKLSLRADRKGKALPRTLFTVQHVIMRNPLVLSFLFFFYSFLDKKNESTKTGTLMQAIICAEDKQKVGSKSDPH